MTPAHTFILIMIPIIVIGAIIIILKLILKKDVQKVPNILEQRDSKRSEMNTIHYQSKNISSNAWLIPLIFVFLDIIVLRGDREMVGYAIWPTLIGGSFGAFILWLNNKEMSVRIENGFLVLKKNSNEIKIYSKDQISSYRISKDQGKTIIRVCGNDKSEYELSSYMLDLKGFDEAINVFLNS